MNAPKPDWYNALREGPVSGKPFTPSMMQKVEKRLFESDRGSVKSRPFRLSWTLPLAVLSIAAAILFIRSEAPDPIDTPLSTPTASTAVTYDPAMLHPGDKVGGMTVESTQRDPNGQQSATVVFSGSVPLEGTYEYSTPLSGYHPEEVVFTPSPTSAARMPRAESMAADSVRFRLSFRDEGEKTKFGTPGSTGTAMLVLTRYNSISAPILDGTPNSGSVQDIQVSTVTAPPALSSDELSGLLQPYSATKRPRFDPNGSLDPAPVADWIQAIDAHFRLPMSEKQANANQREQIRSWLSGAFVASKASELLNQYVISSGDGYMVTGGSPGLLPPGPIKSVKDASLTIRDAAQKEMTFTMTYVMSGTQDAYLTCILKEEKGEVKIDRWTIDYR
ncbi:hypothetical protein [Paenibacillus sp. HJGM_3]|uniref:hypothetical protein n=1 Tax=Paenibacillus sp. HJGM_3 TaxID=3379816 RepID=UPI00385F21AB